jgi:hypothetical protein
MVATAGVFDAAGNAFLVLAAHAGRLDVARGPRQLPLPQGLPPRLLVAYSQCAALQAATKHGRPAANSVGLTGAL